MKSTRTNNIQRRQEQNNKFSFFQMAAMRTKAEFDREFILTQLPENYEYVLTSWDVMGNRNFYVEGRVVGDLNADKVKQWLEEFYESSGASYNQQTGRSDRSHVDSKPGQCHYRAYRKCLCRVYDSQGREVKIDRGKNTGCKAEIKVKLEYPSQKQYKKGGKKQNEQLLVKQESLKNSPFWFRISSDHNHGVKIADYQKLRTVSAETKKVFTDLFEHDLTPSAAWDHHRKQVKAENPNTWQKWCNQYWPSEILSTYGNKKIMC